MKQLSFFICFLIILSPACLRHGYKKPICNGYILYAYAANEDMIIMHTEKSGSIEIVGPTVFSIGYDKNFIIAKQHPAIYPEKENKHITNYFIISLNHPVSWTSQNNAIGPLNENAFREMRKKLNIADTLSFSITFDDIK